MGIQLAQISAHPKYDNHQGSARCVYLSWEPLWQHHLDYSTELDTDAAVSPEQPAKRYITEGHALSPTLAYLYHSARKQYPNILSQK